MRELREVEPLGLEAFPVSPPHRSHTDMQVGLGSRLPGSPPPNIFYLSTLLHKNNLSAVHFTYLGQHLHVLWEISTSKIVFVAFVCVTKRPKLLTVLNGTDYKVANFYDKAGWNK